MKLLRFSHHDAQAKPSGLTVDLETACEEALAYYGIRQGTPMVFDDNWSADEMLNDFSIYLARRKALSTAETYVREVGVFGRFCVDVLGRDLQGARSEDFWRYREYRLHGPLSCRLNPASWNKVAAAILRFLQFRKIVFDVSWRDYRAHGGGGDIVRMIPLSTYLNFRSHGMAKAARTGMRNAAFAELLVTTGLRCSEAGSLLRLELPDERDFDGIRTLRLAIPFAVTKGGRPREVYLSRRVFLDFIAPYIDEERAHIAGKALRSLFPHGNISPKDAASRPDILFFQRAGNGRARILKGSAFKLVPTSSLSPIDRERLIEVEAQRDGSLRPIDFGPLWLSERGRMQSRGAWLSAFASAVKSSGLGGLSVTPHTLRHTFAVHHLSNLIGRMAEARAARQYASSGEQIYDRVIGDPLRQVQVLLGHVNINTTRRYLTYIAGNEEFVDSALADWDSVLAAP